MLGPPREMLRERRAQRRGLVVPRRNAEPKEPLPLVRRDRELELVDERRKVERWRKVLIGIEPQYQLVKRDVANAR
jgi:hypothetical protein